MLVLSRKVDERITIGNDIEILIVRVKGETVRIGIQAPRGVIVMRTELIERPQVELGDDKTLDCGSLGQINPTGFVDAIRAATVDDDAEPLPRFMTPMQKLDWATRGIDKPKNHHLED